MAKKLGTDKHPLILRVQTQQQAYQVVAKCNEHGLKFILGIEPDKPVDVSDLERALDPSLPATSTKAGHLPAVSTKVGRNEPCPCGSGKKYKHCCGA
jgi:SWIM/SEC-C metal-binding protein